MKTWRDEQWHQALIRKPSLCNCWEPIQRWAPRTGAQLQGIKAPKMKRTRTQPPAWLLSKLRVNVDGHRTVLQQLKPAIATKKYRCFLLLKDFHFYCRAGGEKKKSSSQKNPPTPKCSMPVFRHVASPGRALVPAEEADCCSSKLNRKPWNRWHNREVGRWHILSINTSSLCQ